MEDLGGPGVYVGLGTLAVVSIALARSLLLDRSSFKEQANEIERLSNEIDSLRIHQAAIEALYQEQRSAKHQALNDLAKSVMALDLVRQLVDRCTCDAKPLEPLREIIANLTAELTVLHRRHDDP